MRYITICFLLTFLINIPAINAEVNIARSSSPENIEVGGINIKENEDQRIIDEFLLIQRNPFLSLLPKDKVEPKVNENLKPPVVQKVDNNKIPDDVVEYAKNLMIEGLIWGEDQSQAIITGHVVAVGDSLDEGRIVSIDLTWVRIKYKGYSIFLKNKIK